MRHDQTLSEHTIQMTKFYSSSLWLLMPYCSSSLSPSGKLSEAVSLFAFLTFVYLCFSYLCAVFFVWVLLFSLCVLAFCALCSLRVLLRLSPLSSFLPIGLCVGSCDLHFHTSVVDVASISASVLMPSFPQITLDTSVMTPEFSKLPWLEGRPVLGKDRVSTYIAQNQRAKNRLKEHNPPPPPPKSPSQSCAHCEGRKYTLPHQPLHCHSFPLSTFNLIVPHFILLQWVLKCCTHQKCTFLGPTQTY